MATLRRKGSKNTREMVCSRKYQVARQRSALRRFTCYIFRRGFVFAYAVALLFAISFLFLFWYDPDCFATLRLLPVPKFKKKKLTCKIMKLWDVVETPPFKLQTYHWRWAASVLLWLLRSLINNKKKLQAPRIISVTKHPS